MSSDNQKEQELREKQRQLAIAMGKKPKPKPPPPPPKGGPPTKTLKVGGLSLAAAIPSKRPSSQQPLQKKKQTPTMIDLTGGSSTSSSKPKSAPAPALKRPSRPGLVKKRPIAPSSSTASSIKDPPSGATIDLTGESQSGPLPPPKPSPRVQRKTKTRLSSDPSSSSSSKKLGGSSSLLAKLVKDVATTDDLSSTTFAQNTTPEDFWKNLRAWDFVSDLARAQEQQSHQDKADKLSEEAEVLTKKPVPETFINHRHYLSVWVPLCLAETRAQLLSDVMTECSQNQRRASMMILVKVETTWKGGPSRKNHHHRDAPMIHSDLTDVDSINLLINIKERGDGNDWQLYANDMCILVPQSHKDMVERLLKGGKVSNPTDSFSKFGLIGHTEVTRKGLNGLILKVSKRKWAQIGNKQMYIFQIGSNITALREFTALCSIEMLPLKRYLLGQHLESKPKRRPQSSGIKTENQKEQLLSKMGGSQALGKGFTEFARKKFNPSQLTAISESAQGYGDGGFTLIKGPPGTGKTTTLVAVLNSLHIRQYNKYYDEVRKLAASQKGIRQVAQRAKPRLLVCAPSNAAVDNIIMKIMEDGFVDGSGQRYNPSMIRVGVGQSAAVRDVALETKVDQILAENMDVSQLENSILGFRSELQRISSDIVKLRKRAHAIESASQWPLSRDWEIRIDEASFDQSGTAYFVNHRDQVTTYECPPPPEPGESQFPATSMPEYRAFMGRIVKLVESYFSIKNNLERCTIVKGSLESGANHFTVRQALESHVLNTVHIVATTLGTAGSRIFSEGVDKFEVVVVDEAAQSVEPATLAALQLGQRHSVLVGDPQQLPATIFNVSGRNSKYDRSLFQRLEEAGEDVHMLNEQYRMHPKISHFPRHIFYGGNLLDGPNVQASKYGHPLIPIVRARVPSFQVREFFLIGFVCSRTLYSFLATPLLNFLRQPFTVLDLDSKEERGGTSLSNSAEAHLAVHLYDSLRTLTNGVSAKSRVAVITPYAQQVGLLKRVFENFLGKDYIRYVEVNTVDAFQGREAQIVIFSAVRAAGSHGIGFLR